MEISFPEFATWDSNVDCVVFPADVDNKQRIRCLISWEALQDNFGGNEIPPLDCFHQNRYRIEKKAAKLLSQGRFEPDGSILIRSQDGG